MLLISKIISKPSSPILVREKTELQWSMPKAKSFMEMVANSKLDKSYSLEPLKKLKTMIAPKLWSSVLILLEEAHFLLS